MEMHEIRYFLAACETLNFHRAAERVNVTQPALTRAIQKLESELGGFLFRREHNQVQLTDFGRLMRTHLDDVHRRSELAKSAARGFLKLEAAPLSLGVMCTIGPLRFVGFLNALRERQPGLELKLTEAPATNLRAMLLEGRLDAALMALPVPLDSKLTFEPLYREWFGLCFAAGHRFELRNTLQLSDVAGEPYLDRINCEFGSHIDDLCRARGVRIDTAFESEREDWIIAMVAAGLGVCFLPEFSALQPGVGHRRVADPEIVREVSLVTVAGRLASPALAAFREAVAAYGWPD